MYVCMHACMHEYSEKHPSISHQVLRLLRSPVQTRDSVMRIIFL
uniref:Uncharacterized protein n=1 Tax=Populus trichocarpa TaxID=3694 RepID=A0A3N7H0Q4_POPTR